MIVAGAGMSGLLAACMLRNECSSILEAQPCLPINHSAVLRFRSTAVSDILNIPFKKVTVMKAIQPWRNPVAEAMAYSVKCNGHASMRSISSGMGKVDRYIAPQNLVQQMANMCSPQSAGVGAIDFGLCLDIGLIQGNGEPIISTLPMPMLMKMLEWETKSQFRSVSGFNLTCTLQEVEAYCSVYVPEPTHPYSRVSITDNRLIVEIPDPHSQFAEDEFSTRRELHRRIIQDARMHLGVLGVECLHDDIECRRQKYAKILPIDENERQRFILWATEKHNVYSLGRFATWRPGLLLDDVVNDVRVIHRLANGATQYEAKKK